MVLDVYSPLALKRRRLTTIHAMEADAANYAKFAAVKEKFGRDIHVFETLGASPSSNQATNDEESDDFYEFTAEDYHRIMATKKEDKYLKTRKIREAEEASRRSKITKAAIRVRFPDNITLEVVFSPSEKIQSLYDLLAKVIAHPELPFYLYTTPPKKQIKDLSQDFYSAGFIPGAILYFSYDLPKGNDLEMLNSSPFLQEEIVSLKGLEIVSEPAQPVQSALEPEIIPPAAPSFAPQEPKSAGKKPVKPKWLKL